LNNNENCFKKFLDITPKIDFSTLKVGALLFLGLTLSVILKGTVITTDNFFGIML